MCVSPSYRLSLLVVLLIRVVAFYRVYARTATVPKLPRSRLRAEPGPRGPLSPRSNLARQEHEAAKKACFVEKWEHLRWERESEGLGGGGEVQVLQRGWGRVGSGWVSQSARGNSTTWLNCLLGISCVTRDASKRKRIVKRVQSGCGRFPGSPKEPRELDGGDGSRAV